MSSAKQFLQSSIFKFLLVLIASAALAMPSHAQIKKRGKEKAAKLPEVQLNEKERQEFTRYFFDGNKAKILGDYGQAKKYFEKALAIDPSSGATHFELAKLYAERGQFTEAAQMASVARTSDLTNVWYAHFLAQVYAELGNLDASIDVYRDIVKRQPDDYENLFNLANLLSAHGKYKEALDIYGNLESRLGPSEEISVQRQVIYLEKGELDKALKEVNTLIESNPEEIRYLGMKAEILQNMNRPKEAQELYEIMLADSPNNGLVLLALYEMSEQAGEREKAEDYLYRAFRSPELNIDVKVNIMLNYLSGRILRERPDFVIGLGDAMERAHPKEAKAFAIQGDVFYNLGKLEEARDKFRKAVELDANRPPIWQQILTIDSQLNDFTTMRSEGEQALELFPMQPIFYLFTAVAALQQKEAERAAELLESGKALIVDNDAMTAQFWSTLGDAYHELGKNHLSDAAYDQALAIDGSNAVVLNNYAYYLSVRNEKLEKAENMAKKANNLVPNTASFQDTYGWVLYMRGNYRNALFWIEEALKNGADNDPVVLDHYGDVLLVLDRRADAVKAWQRALEAGGKESEILPKIQRNQFGQ